MKTLAASLIEGRIGVTSAIRTAGTRKSHHGGTRVDHGGLLLGRVSHPNVDVVGAIPLVEAAELLLRQGAKYRALIVAFGFGFGCIDGGG